MDPSGSEAIRSPGTRNSSTTQLQTQGWGWRKKVFSMSDSHPREIPAHEWQRWQLPARGWGSDEANFTAKQPREKQKQEICFIWRLSPLMSLNWKTLSSVIHSSLVDSCSSWVRREGDALEGEGGISSSSITTKKWAHFSTRKLICSPYGEWENNQTAAPKGVWVSPEGPCMFPSSLRSDRVKQVWENQRHQAQSKPLKPPVCSEKTGNYNLTSLFPCYQCSG